VFFNGNPSKQITGQCLLREINEVKFDFIRDESVHFPVTVLCRVSKLALQLITPGRCAQQNWLVQAHCIYTSGEGAI